MRPGTTGFLVATAFAVLLALAILTVVLGVITALKVHDVEEAATDDPKPATRATTRGIPV
ncbi:hypothetical protein [Kitasatospora sp. NPDC092286]|uniref:hypothetical protein n=1 Tax=Kitasatospora sp. NPDC092286 TaxID=3364087 RepID=UPI003814F9A2